MTSNTTTETTQTTRKSERLPAIPTSRSIELRLTTRFSDQETGAHERFEVDSSLSVPMPDTTPQIRFAYDPTPRDNGEARRTAMLVEDFFSGIGLELPSRTKAKEMLTTIGKLNAERADEQRRFNNTTERLEGLVGTNANLARNWQAYAEALEARIERGGGRISAKMFATRPTPRG